MELGAIKSSIAELKSSEKQVKIKFRNVDVNVKASYLKRLKDPEKYISNLWHKKTETQIRHLARENRLNEVKGLVYLQNRNGFETTHPTQSLIDILQDQRDDFTQLLDDSRPKPSSKKIQVITTIDEDGNIEVDIIYLG